MNTPTASPETAAAPAAENVSGSDLAASLLGDAVAVPAPVETAPIAPPASVTGSAPVKDSLGREFDAKKYRMKPDGSPFLNARGHFMPRGGRKPGRATGSAAAQPAQSPVSAGPRVSVLPPIPEAPKPAETAPDAKSGPVPPAPAAPAVSRSAMEQTAEGYLRTAYVLADGFLDAKGEWQPDDAAEHAGLKEPLVEHLIISGAQPLPSWARFAVAAVAFVAKRFSRPNTKRAASAWWSKVNGAKPVQPAAPERPAQPQATVSPLYIEPLR